MTSRPPFAAPALMPRGMTIPEWRALVSAANRGWPGYVFPPYWLWLNFLGVALLLWVDRGFVPVHDPGALPSHFVRFHPVLYILGWTNGLHVLCRTIDWLGKRKLARRIGLLPAASGNP